MQKLSAEKFHHDALVLIINGNPADLGGAEAAATEPLYGIRWTLAGREPRAKGQPGEVIERAVSSSVEHAGHD
jgi:hypothetical protein